MENNEVTSNATVVEVKDQLGSKTQSDRIEEAIGRKLKRAKVILSDGDIADLKKEIAGLLKAETNSQFKIGDKLLKLRSEGGCKWPELGKELGRNHTTLCTYAKVAEAFPPDARDYALGFSFYAAVYSSAKITARQLKEKGLDEEADADYVGALKQCLEAEVTTSRQATKFLVTAAGAQLPKPQPSSYDGKNCIHMAVEKYLETCPPLGAKIIHADVPFGAFHKRDDGVCDRTTTKAQLSECDNASRDEAIGTTVAFFESLGKRLDEHLVPGGVVLLWQSEHLRWQIHKAIVDAGLEVFRTVFWPKSASGKPGNFGYPWQNCAEVLYVIHRTDDKVVFGEHGRPARNLLFSGYLPEEQRDKEINTELKFAPIRQSKLSVDKKHHFQKPLDLMKFLVKLHSAATVEAQGAELVVDAFGCSGSMSIAALSLGRKFLYIESNAENFAFGTENIAAEQERLASLAAPDVEAKPGASIEVPILSEVAAVSDEEIASYSEQRVPF